jgi:8-oxo-dGTP diphosphatase
MPFRATHDGLSRFHDLVWRLALISAYRMARLWWLVRRPRHFGALVALWHDGKLLMVRTSYRPRWSLPGGGIRSDETPLAAARRELREELGIDLPVAALREVFSVGHFWESRNDHVTIFAAQLAKLPAFRIDRREIIAAAFRDPATLPADELLPPVASYIASLRC